MHDENAHERRATNIAVTHGVQQRSISTPASMENRHGNSRKNSHTQDRGERTHQMSPNSTAGPESSTTQPPTRLDSQQGTCAFTLSTTHESGRSVRRSLRVVLLQNWQHLQRWSVHQARSTVPNRQASPCTKGGPHPHTVRPQRCRCHIHAMKIVAASHREGVEPHDHAEWCADHLRIAKENERMGEI